MDKISKEIAQAEVESWLDYKKISAKKRESQKDQIESLVDALVEGTLSMNDDKTIVHQLKFEIGEEIKISKLEYKPRLKMSAIHLHLSSVKSSDADGRVCAYISALTGLPKDILKAMDSEDYSISQSIALFFI